MLSGKSGANPAQFRYGINEVLTHLCHWVKPGRRVRAVMFEPGYRSIEAAVFRENGRTQKHA